MIDLFEIDDFMEEELEKCKHPFSALPLYAHNKNIRAVVPQSLWTKIRKEVLEEHDFTCHVCGLKKKADEKGTNWHAHEGWDFDEENRVLILTSIKSICKKCHNIEHFMGFYSRARQLPYFNKYMNDLLVHFTNINNCSMDCAIYGAEKLISSYSLVLVGKARLDEVKRQRELATEKWYYKVEANIPYKEKVLEILDSKGLLYL